MGEVQVNFLCFLRMLKMLDESENRRQQGAMVGFSRDRTDKLYSAFQALEPESSGALPTVNRRVLEQVLEHVSRTLPKVQLGEILQMLNQGPMQVQFTAFLRIMRVMEGMVENQFEACIRDILGWHGIHVQHDGEPEDSPK